MESWFSGAMESDSVCTIAFIQDKCDDIRGCYFANLVLIFFLTI